jgi:hypothetical protein
MPAWNYNPPNLSLTSSYECLFLNELIWKKKQQSISLSACGNSVRRGLVSCHSGHMMSLLLKNAEAQKASFCEDQLVYGGSFRKVENCLIRKTRLYISKRNNIWLISYGL